MSKVLDFDWDFCKNGKELKETRNELRACRDKTIQALIKIKEGFKELKTILKDYEGFDWDLSENYPFKHDIQDYDIEEWINTTITKLLFEN